MNKIVVVGGGAAGMMAAIVAAKAGSQVTLYEKNEKLGKKIFITGKGRCNVTNACDLEDLFRQVISNPKFLYSSFYSFDNQAVMRFFEEAGCSLKIERGDRVFPVSDHSSDIISVLERQMKKYGVSVILNSPVRSLWIEEGTLKGIALNQGKKVAADKVVVATGGISYPLTGSTGDGYEMAKQCGHTITDLSPALVPLEVEEEWCKELQGLALKNVKVTISDEKKELYSDFGEMLFTHFGVSGPLILSGSSIFAKKKKTETGILTIDLKPALTVEQLDKRLLRDFEENINKQFKNAIGGLFPTRLIPVMIQISGIDPEKKVNEISKEERKQFIDQIKGLKLHITGFRDYREAIITQGGIKVKEINPSTMESKQLANLYFAGEVLDLDALTGGYNLQIAWSTGYLAGESAAV